MIVTPYPKAKEINKMTFSLYPCGFLFGNIIIIAKIIVLFDFMQHSPSFSSKYWFFHRIYVKILPLQCRLYWHHIPSWYLLTGGIYLVLFLRAIWGLCHPLPHRQGITYLYTFTISLRRPTVHLHSHKVVALPGPLSGHQRPQMASISTKDPEPTQAPTKILQKRSVPVQISPTVIDPG